MKNNSASGRVCDVFLPNRPPVGGLNPNAELPHERAFSVNMVFFYLCVYDGVLINVNSQLDLQTAGMPSF